jgi:flagellar secretion chaperone FliS
MNIFHLASRGMRGLEQYQSLALTSRLETADPYQLVGILYEELDRALDIAACALECDSAVASGQPIDRARSILIALQASLNFDDGGGLAVSLSAVYQAMRRALDKAAQLRSAPALRDIGEGVASLAEAWRALALRGHSLSPSR